MLHLATQQFAMVNIVLTRRVDRRRVPAAAAGGGASADGCAADGGRGRAAAAILVARRHAGLGAGQPRRAARRGTRREGGATSTRTSRPRSSAASSFVNRQLLRAATALPVCGKRVRGRRHRRRTRVSPPVRRHRPLRRACRVDASRLRGGGGNLGLPDSAPAACTSHCTATGSTRRRWRSTASATTRTSAQDDVRRIARRRSAPGARAAPQGSSRVGGGTRLRWPPRARRRRCRASTLPCAPTYVRSPTFAEFDSRTSPGYTRERRTLSRWTSTDYQQVNGGAFSFSRVDAEVQRFVPLFGDS